MVLGDLFWSLATSNILLGADLLLLLAAAVVGYFPLVGYIPAVAPYVKAARLVVALVALLMAFLIGFRAADEREEAKSLRSTIAAQRADLENSRKARADEAARADAIAEGARAQYEADIEYIGRLEADDRCKFDPFGRVRDRAARGSSAASGSAARSAAGAR
ncbi:outer membrane murein-binding lipoprotein Lpp [Bradyrhizobium embrapense]